MRRFFFKTVLVAVFALVAIAASAQRVVNGIELSKKQIAEYLVSNPSDTVVMALSEVKKEGEIRYVERRIGFIAGNKLMSRRDTLIYLEASSAEIALSDKEAVLRGELRAYNPEHQRADGSNVHHVNVSVLGGANYVDNSLNAVATLRVGYETCHFLFEVEGSYSTMAYTSTATTSGKYDTFIAAGNVGWKFLQSRNYRSYLAIFGSAGYAYQRTDKPDAEVTSDNFGLTLDAALRGAWGFAKRYQLVVEAGYRVLPQVFHGGGTQDFTNGGPFVNLGVNMSF